MKLIFKFLVWLGISNAPRQGSMKRSYPEADPKNDVEFEELISTSKLHGIDVALQQRANKLALRLRSRAIDLATYHADGSPEDVKIINQCKLLTKIAGSEAHDFLKSEYGE